MKNQRSFLYSFFNNSRLGFFILIPFLFYSCTTLELNSVKGGESLNLTSNSQKESNVNESVPANCKPTAKKYQWYILFGSVPINKIDTVELLPDSNRNYRVILRTSWLDGILSTFLGIAASITRKTIDVENCDLRDSSSLKNSTPNGVEKTEKELSKADAVKIKEEFIKQNEKQWKEELQEKIHSSLSEELESAWNKEIKHSKNLSILFLKSGEIVKGTVTRIDGDGVKLFSKGKERIFRRADVQRVRFQD